MSFLERPFSFHEDVHSDNPGWVWSFWELDEGVPAMQVVPLALEQPGEELSGLLVLGENFEKLLQCVRLMTQIRVMWERVYDALHAEHRDVQLRSGVPVVAGGRASIDDDS